MVLKDLSVASLTAIKPAGLLSAFRCRIGAEIMSTSCGIAMVSGSTNRYLNHLDYQSKK